MSSKIAGPLFDEEIRSHIPPDPPHKEFVPPPDRAFFADPEKKQLLSQATKVEHLTESIGTLLHGIQLSQLNPAQKDELALLVAERGVVFFRNQDLTTSEQEKFFEHYGILDTHPAQQNRKTVDINGSNRDWREDLVHTPWPVAALHADTSFEINPPSYAMLRMEEHPPFGGDTLWVSQYGTYDALSATLKRFADTLRVVHTSWLQYQTIISLWGGKPRRKPIDTEHPLVRTHPVTGWKALNINPGFSTRIVGLKKAESDKLYEFFVQHLEGAADHQVRWKWEVGSVAMWDNRISAHRVIPGKYKENRRGVRTTVFGERPYFDPESIGREEEEEKIAGERGEKIRGDQGRKFLNGSKENGVPTPS